MQGEAKATENFPRNAKYVHGNGGSASVFSPSCKPQKEYNRKEHLNRRSTTE